jgi:hypothetical protein
MHYYRTCSMLSRDQYISTAHIPFLVEAVLEFAACANDEFQKLEIPLLSVNF